MNTTIENQTQDTPYIPEDSEVNVQAGRMPWRFSEGKIVTGREEDNNLVSREKIVGILKRIGVHTGVGKQDNVPYSQLEADIQTKHEGVVRIKANLSDKTGAIKPSVAALSFAEGLLDCALGEVIALGASQSKEKNKYGNYSTYANVFHVRPNNNVERTTKRERDKTLSMDEQWELLEKDLLTHPAYAERPASDHSDDEKTHLSELCRELTEKGWPTPEEATPEWLAVLPNLLKGHIGDTASLNDYSQDEWGEVRQALKGREKPDEMPKFLAPAVKRLQKEKKSESAPKKDDPFA